MNPTPIRSLAPSTRARGNEGKRRGSAYRSARVVVEMKSRRERPPDAINEVRS